MVKKCPCCNSKKIKLAYKNLYDKQHLVKGNFSLFKCSDCKMEFINPLLNEKQLSNYYPEEEYYSFKENKLALMYHKVSAYYYSRKNLFANIFLYPLKPLLYTYYIDPGKTLLEIGCGNGLSLEVYQNYGLQTRGLEPNGPKLSKKEKTLGISRNTIKKASYYKNSFDYIVLREVLEHIPNQKQVLSKCREWLKPSGKLIVTVPNTNGLWRRIFKQNWCGYDVPRHLYNYNPKNISFLLKKSGYRIERIKVYDLPYMLYDSLKFYLVEKRGKKQNNVVTSSLSKLLFMPASLIASFLNSGSLMEIECSKI